MAFSTLLRTQFKASLMTNKFRQQVLERDNYTCNVCKQVYDRKILVVHHVIPLSLGGKDTLDNMITVCTKKHHAPSEPKK